MECGSWLGLSARLLVSHASNAVVVCVDHWRGSPEHQPDTGNHLWSVKLPTLHEQFLANMWPWRDRVIPLRADSLDGLAEVFEAGLSPDFVYLDSEHSVDRVSRELDFCETRWPAMPIVGDDIDNSAVRLAVDKHRERYPRNMSIHDGGFTLDPLGA